MNKLLVICGPTATGKTPLALNIAYQYRGELLSADSRQVYEGVPALTGKDIPEAFSFYQSHLTYQQGSIGYWGNGTNIWLTDFVPLDRMFNVSWYADAASVVLNHLWDNHVLPIAVGGTGLYLNAITKSLAQMYIPAYPEIRKQFLATPRETLQKEVERVNPTRWEQMNNSDRNNPRRLIRALEIAKFLKLSGEPKEKNVSMDTLWIGLTASNGVLETRIRERVRKRWQKAIEEVRLFSNAMSPSASTILGVKPLLRFLEGSMNQEEAIDEWGNGEWDYAKRQITWFKKQKDIHWFNTDANGYQNAIFSLIDSWYTKEV